MKKTLSFLLVLLLMISTTATAYASQLPSAERVEKQIEGAVSYLTEDVDSYTIDTAADFASLVQCNADVSRFSDGFLKSVKENLDKNNGKIIGAYGESLATYGAVIVAISMLGENTDNFYGYDIESAFLAMDPNDTSFSPNYYRFIIPAAIFCEKGEAFAKSVCDAYISNYYTMGKGVDYYGFSCDNLSYFIEAITWLSEEYEVIIKDAYDVLETYHTNGGYFSDAQYSTEPNTDSTALALLALANMPDSLIDDYDPYINKINSTYNELCRFEGSAPGIFINTYTDEDDFYATKEALLALSAYYPFALLQNPDNNDETTEKHENTSSSKENPTGVNNSKKSPDTGADTTLIAAAVSITAGLTLAFLLKRKK